MRSRKVRGVVTLLLALSLLPAGGPTALGEHGTTEGHLIGSGQFGIIELVGRLDLADAGTTIGDVAVSPDGNWAFLATAGQADCSGDAKVKKSPDAGVFVIDISAPAHPRQAGFIQLGKGSLPGDALQVAEVTTTSFSGWALLVGNEPCGKGGKGGFSLWNVTNPLDPKKLVEHFGAGGFNATADIGTAFAWDAGDSAYVAAGDESRPTVVTIFDITNPVRPRPVAEYDLSQFDIDQPELTLSDTSLQGITVKQIAGRFVMLLSAGDGGHVLLDVTDPAAAVFVGDTDYSAIDPELLESFGVSLTPEGNAHYAEFTADNRFFIGTDEDSEPYRTLVFTDDGGSYPAGEFGWTIPIASLGGTLNGPTVYGGYGCPSERGSIPNASTLTLAAGEESILVLQRGPVGDPSRSDSACFFSEKVETAQLLGYDAVLIANHHAGARGGEAPDLHFCGSMEHSFTVQISALCVGHRAMHDLFDDPNAEDNYTYPESVPAVGTFGDRITVTTQFDGWGYVHLYDRTTRQEIDTYAIPEAHDPSFAVGFGDLSVHEVATDPTRGDVAYMAYNSGGLRAVQIQCADPDNTSTCELVEVGGYLGPQGNDFAGVEAFVRGGQTYVLASDRDSGLWIFRVKPLPT